MAIFPILHAFLFHLLPTPIQCLLAGFFSLMTNEGAVAAFRTSGIMRGLFFFQFLCNVAGLSDHDLYCSILRRRVLFDVIETLLTSCSVLPGYPVFASYLLLF